jgi:aldehyde dehydrogenase (NAD+)
MMLAEAVEQSGIPKGVVNVVPAGREVREHLVRHPGVDKVAFTGSTAAGRRIGAICGELKRVTLDPAASPLQSCSTTSTCRVPSRASSPRRS